MKLKKPETCLDWFKLYLLYKQAFPIYERKPFAMIYHTFKNGGSDVWCLEENNTFIGLAITLITRDLVLLDYYAIKEEMRGQNYGSKGMKAMFEHYENKRLFVEIESIFDDCDNLDERLKRKHFYLKNGMQECKVLANVYGTDMELLSNQFVSFEDYYSVYVDVYGTNRPIRLIEKKYPK